MLFYRISQGITKLIREKGEKLGLSSAQVQTLIFLSGAHPGNKYVGSIATRLGIAQPTATRIVDSLEKKGLIERKRSEEDRRKVKLQITDEGHNLIEEITGINEKFQEIIDDLPADHKERLTEDLISVADRMQREGKISPALVCRYCKYFVPGGGNTKGRPHYCKLLGRDLSDEESYMEWVHDKGEKTGMFR